MNKAIRHELNLLQWKRKLKQYVPRWNGYINRKGEYIQRPKIVDVINDNGQLHYRNDNHPCSCWCCSPPDKKYNRAKIKSEFLTIQRGTY